MYIYICIYIYIYIYIYKFFYMLYLYNYISLFIWRANTITHLYHIHAGRQRQAHIFTQISTNQVLSKL